MSMETKVVLALALLSGVALQAQVQAPQGQDPAQAPTQVQAPAQTPAGNPPAPPAAAPAAAQKAGTPGAKTAQAAKPAPKVLKTPVYVRRFSVGLGLSIQGMTMMQKNTVNRVTSNPTVDALYTSADLSHRVGYGITAQLALTERLAVTGDVFIRHVGYSLNSDVYTGDDLESTPTVDDRVYTVKNENTRARFMDIPVLVRYYAKDRHESGPRVFFEAGGAIRKLSHISTWTDSSTDYAATVCCGREPAGHHASTVRGAVAGFGVQINDPVGIRVVPEVRYTHWFNEPFQNATTGLMTRRHEVTAMISLTF
jgi:hypothetical protein